MYISLWHAQHVTWLGQHNRGFFSRKEEHQISALSHRIWGTCDSPRLIKTQKRSASPAAAAAAVTAAAAAVSRLLAGLAVAKAASNAGVGAAAAAAAALAVDCAAPGLGRPRAALPQLAAADLALIHAAEAPSGGAEVPSAPAPVVAVAGSTSTHAKPNSAKSTDMCDTQGKNNRRSRTRTNTSRIRFVL